MVKLCLVRFLGLLTQNSDTSDPFYTFNILKFKRLAPKGHITETQQNVNTCVMLGFTGLRELVLKNTPLQLHQVHGRQEHRRTELTLAERATTPSHCSQTICHLLQLIHNRTVDYAVQVLEKVSQMKQTQSSKNQLILVLDLRSGCDQLVKEFCTIVENFLLQVLWSQAANLSIMIFKTGKTIH